MNPVLCTVGHVIEYLGTIFNMVCVVSIFIFFGGRQVVVHPLQRLRRQPASCLAFKQRETKCPHPCALAFFPHSVIEVLAEVVVFNMVDPGEYRVIAVLAMVELLSLSRFRNRTPLSSLCAGGCRLVTARVVEFSSFVRPSPRHMTPS